MTTEAYTQLLKDKKDIEVKRRVAMDKINDWLIDKYSIAIKNTYKQIDDDKREKFAGELESLLKKFSDMVVKSRAKYEAVEILDKSVSDVGFSIRIPKALRKNNISTVRELVGKGEVELLSYVGLGNTSLREIKRKLGDYGLSPGMDTDKLGD